MPIKPLDANNIRPDNPFSTTRHVPAAQGIASAFVQESPIISDVVGSALFPDIGGEGLSRERLKELISALPSDELEYVETYSLADSEAEFQLMRDEVAWRRQRRQDVRDIGALGVAASFAAGLLSPTTLIPVAGLTSGVARSALRTGASVAGAVAVDEAILRSADPTRTSEETAWAIGGAAVLGGVLGGATKYFDNRRLAQAIADVENPIPPTIQEVAAGTAGAQMVRPGSVRGLKETVAKFTIPSFVPAIGGNTYRPIDKIVEWTSPWTKAINDNMRANRPLTKSVEALSQMDSVGRPTLAEEMPNPDSALGLAMHGNSGGLLLGMSRGMEDAYKANAIGAFLGSYLKHVNIDAKTMPIESAEVQSLLQKIGFKPPEGKLTLAEFDADLFVALNNGDVSPTGVKEVTEAAQLIRKDLDQLGEMLLETGQITKEEMDLALRVSNTSSFMPHVFNKLVLEQKQGEFATRYIDHHVGRLMETLQERVTAAYAERKFSQQLARDVGLSPEAQETLRNVLKEEISALSSTKGAADLANVADLRAQATQFRAAAKKARADGDAAAAVQMEDRARVLAQQARDAKSAEGTNVKLRKQQLQRRLSNLNRSYTSILGKRVAAYEKIENLQSDILERTERVIEQSNKFFDKLAKVKNERQRQALIDDIFNKIERAEASIARAEERINRIARQSQLREQGLDVGVNTRPGEELLAQAAGIPMENGRIVLRTDAEKAAAVRALSQINVGNKLPSGESITPEIRGHIVALVKRINAADISTRYDVDAALEQFNRAMVERAKAEDRVAKLFEDLRKADDFSPEEARNAVIIARDAMLRKADKVQAKRHAQIAKLKDQLTAPAPAKFITRDGKEREFKDGIVFVDELPKGDSVTLRGKDMFDAAGEQIKYTKRAKKGRWAIALEEPVDGTMGVKYKATSLGEVDSHIPAVKGDGRLDPDFAAARAEYIEAESLARFLDFEEQLELAVSGDPEAGLVRQLVDLETGTVKEEGVREMLRREADEIVQRILATDTRYINKDGAELDAIVGLRGPVRKRVLQLPFEQKKDFLVQDPLRVLIAYYRKVVPDIHMKRRFGTVNETVPIKEMETEYNQLRKEIETDETLTPTERDAELADLLRRHTQDKETFKLMVDRLRYLRDVPGRPDAVMRRAGETMLRSSSILYLGGTVPASFPDIARAVVRYGADSFLQDGLGQTFTPGLRKELMRLAQQDGIALNGRINVSVTGFSDVGDTITPTMVERIVETLSLINGRVALFDYYDDWLKTYASAQARAQFSKAMETVMTGREVMRPKDARVVLSRAGVDDTLAARIWTQMRKQALEENGNPDAFSRTNSGAIAIDIGKWADQGAKDATRSFVWHETNTLVVTPGIADIPEFADRNLAFKLLMSVRSFMMSSTSKILAADLAKWDKDVALGFVVASGLAIISYYAWAASFGFGSQQWKEAVNADWSKLADEIIARNGYLGVLQEGRNILASNAIIHGLTTFSDEGTDKKQFFNDTIYKIMGVNGTTFRSMDQLMSSLVPGPTDQTAQALGKLLPYNNVFYLRWLADRVQEQAEVYLPSRSEALNQTPG